MTALSSGSIKRLRRCRSWIVLYYGKERISRCHCELFAKHQGKHTYIWNTVGNTWVAIIWKRNKS